MLRRALWPIVLPVLAYLAYLAGLGGMLAVLLTGVPSGPVVTGAFVGMQAAGIALTGWAAYDRRLSPRERRPWVLVLVSWLLGLPAGPGLAVAVDAGSRASGVLWWGTVAGTLAQSVALLAGVLLIPRRALSRRERFTFALDMTTVAGGGFMLTWYLILGPAALRHDTLFPWAGLVLGVIVMTGAVAVRQWASLRESRRLAATDALTGLANRSRFREEMEPAVERGDTAVLLVDLDGFKQVNDVLGHDAGDRVLIEFARVLTRSLRKADVAARVGGDEFCVLLADVTAPEQAIMVAERIIAGGLAVRTGEAPHGLRMSVGIALAEPGLVPAEVLAHADSAMYAAKRRRSHGWELYAQTADDLAEGLLADELTNAIRGGRLSVVYQPIVNLADGRMIGAEALVRWPRPDGAVYPDVFVPLAERTGVIGELGMFVLRDAVEHAAGWRAAAPDFYVTVNLSAHQLREPRLVERVTAELERAGLPPGHLVLELTESALVTERTDITVLERLRAHGVRIAIDDFGTGYSSLRYLTRLPVDVLKLDRSFVGELNGAPEGSAVTEAVIRLSQILRLCLVAEGVETEAQVRELMLLGCTTGQGYHFWRPMDAAAMDRLVGQPVRTR